MLYADCHMHSHFSADSNASMGAMIESAIDKGLKTICFTEHMDYDYPPDTFEGQPAVFEVDMPSYIEEINMMKSGFASKIEILFGIELGLMPYLAPRYKSFVNQYPFDFIIGSSHLVDGRDPYYPEYFEGRSEFEAYSDYFETIPANITAFDDFDSYGHIDYVVRYGPHANKDYTYEIYRDVMDKVLKSIIESGKALEINTGGYKKGLGQPHPQADVLARYRELGGELITIGADAHAPEQIADAFDRAEEVLKSIGFKYYAVYKNRKPVMYKI